MPVYQRLERYGNNNETHKQYYECWAKANDHFRKQQDL
ncbi:hypothetical protein D777_00419 [Marinobacter nitratireducens]|uniref:Uncharacterized protein n=1 Tax=Marinobacter nitratireducens TaxID=1137280 RepID=A0A072N6G2_9GAMM|nr:hypothetical protein D777_00419 [Marinobacter nitratireducens]